MPAARSRGTLNITRQLSEAYDEFAGYMEIQKPEMTAMFLEESVGLFEGITFENLNLVFVVPRRVFPELLRGRRDASQSFNIRRETYEAYDLFGESLAVGTSWVLRAAMMHGLALEMEKERFVPEIGTPG